MAVRKPGNSRLAPKDLSDISTLFAPPPPLQSSNLSQYEVNELRKPIQCSDKMSVEVASALQNKRNSK